MASGYKRKKGWWIFPLLCVVSIYAVFTFYSQSNEMYMLQLQMKQIEQRIQKEEELKQSLLAEKEALMSDESIERIAREKLGMVRDGEKVFVDINK